MTTNNDIYRYLIEYAPLELQEDYDNAGFLCGDKEAQCRSVIMALDATSKVIDEAVSAGADMIITHHPLIWGSFKSVVCDDITGKKLNTLIKNGISVISMHTNLDKVLVNDVLIDKLGAVSVEKVNEFMRAGLLEKPMPMSEYAAFCSQRLNNSSVRYYDSGRPAHKVSCIGGAGDEGLREAYEAGCDTYVTADVRHHVYLEAAELGMNIIDADHFNTEDPVIPVLRDMLAEKFPEVSFSVAKSDIQVVRYA